MIHHALPGSAYTHQGNANVRRQKKPSRVNFGLLENVMVGWLRHIRDHASEFLPLLYRQIIDAEYVAVNAGTRLAKPQSHVSVC